MKMSEVSLNSESDIKLIEIDSRQVLLFSSHPNEFYFTGVMNIKCVVGSLEIMGYQITPNHSPMTVFSSKENYVLKLTMLENCSKTTVLDERYLQAFNFPDSIASLILSKSSSHVILLSKNEKSCNLLSVLKFYNMPVFLKENSCQSILNYLKADVTKFQKYEEHVLWFNISSVITRRKQHRTLLCGGKGVGKSTLLKFLINKSLEKWPEVIVIDLDPGQPEFTVMGCLSTVLVRQPITGPNFSHLTIPEKCLYLGDISVTNSSDTYVRYVKNIVDYCHANWASIPWFINTMGFNQELGVKLLFHILQNVRPTDVIQINSTKLKHNFSQHLSPEFWKSEGYTNSKVPKYEFHSLPSLAESSNVSFDATSWGLHSVTKRNIVILSYFSAVTKANNGSLLSVIPRKISLDNIRIVIDNSSCKDMPVMSDKLQILCCINANLVALCYSDETSNVLECIGFGIVRGFDEKTEDLFIITPLTEDHLERVNVIAFSSSIQLPDVVYHKQTPFNNSQTPYLMHSSEDILHQKVKKSSSRLKSRNNQSKSDFD